MSGINVSGGSWRERAVYLLLFLLPAAGNSVRHWISATFSLLVLLALPDTFRRHQNLDRAERTLLLIAAACFFLFVVTSLFNGWTEAQTGFATKEIRFLLLIPIYLMLRHYVDAGRWLIRGSVVAGFTLLAQALYDVYVPELGRAQGIYSPNLFGPFAAMLAVFMLVLRRIERDRRWLRYVVAASIPAALTAVALSVSRGAYVGVIGMLGLWAALRFRTRPLVLAALVVLGFAGAGYALSDHVQRGVHKAAGEVIRVIQHGELTHTPDGRLDSVSARLVIWHAAMLVACDNPLWGVGRGNYINAVRPYVEKGQAHPEVVEYDHPHNAYLEMLVSKGIVGLILFVALLLFPFHRFWRARHQAPEIAALGMILITGFALFSLTDASTFIKGNFISIYLIYLAALFSWLVRAVRERKPE